MSEEGLPEVGAPSLYDGPGCRRLIVMELTSRLAAGLPPPSFRELQTVIQKKSPAVVTWHLKILLRQGIIEVVGKRGRGKTYSLVVLGGSPTLGGS